MKLRMQSMISGTYNEMEIPMTIEAFDEAYKKCVSGTLIQHAFPTLDANQREFIKTGITPDEWEKCFAKET